MKFKSVLLAALPVVVLSFASCSSDDGAGIPPIIIDEPSIIIPYTVPDTYTFERTGETTVDFSGQSSRLLMLQEMGNYIKDQGTNAAVVDVSKLSSMYANTGNQFASADLNASGKQLRDKTAASRDYFVNLGGGGTIAEQGTVRTVFENQFTSANAASQGSPAAAGTAGVYQDGTSKRLLAANGLEPQQVLLKGMMGACFMDQICNNYLSLAVLDEGNNKINNTNKVLEADKKYTKMEHLWDEAYGYIYGAGGGKYWDSYINQVDADYDFGTVKEDINLAFRKGRAAISANDYAVRDAQINIIKAKLALIPAVRAVFYLKEGQAKLTIDNGAKAFHALSEGYGFIMSLRYTNKPGTSNPYLTKTEVDTILNSLTSGTNGLWDVDHLNTVIDGLATQIATKFGFTVAQAQTITPTP